MLYFIIFKFYNFDIYLLNATSFFIFYKKKYYIVFAFNKINVSVFFIENIDLINGSTVIK